MIGKVLQFRAQSPAESLRLREVAKEGVGEISQWFAENKGARAKFRIRVQHLLKMLRTDWNVAQFRKLDDGLAEIKWKCGKKQFRAIGFDFSGSFVMVLGCTHKMNVYAPSECLKTAQRIKGEVENGIRQTIEFTP
jgi:hypothetical protein